MIQCENVSKNYLSGRGAVQALSGVSFSTGSVKTVAVVGKSGSGKTTLLNCLGGLDRPDQGTIVCFDQEIHSLTARQLSLFVRRELGYVFQFGNLLSYLSVAENITFSMTLNHNAPKIKARRVRELLERIGLPKAAHAMPHELSGGEVQRVSVARAIAHFPRMLLADEPTASLDTATGKELVKLMFDMGKEQGCIMILSTHDPDILGLADAAIILRDGKIEQKPGLS